MKISIFTLITNPRKYQYAYMEAIDCYSSFADEVIIVDGAGEKSHEYKEISERFKDRNIKFVYLYWPEKWDWIELPKHLNAGLLNCSGDIAIKMDIDYLLHEEDFDNLRKSLQEIIDKDYMIGAFVKKNILNKKYAYQKAVLPNAINLKYRNQIRYGRTEDDTTDWCQPLSIADSELDKDLPVGREFKKSDMAWLSCNIYNYDAFFRTKEFQKKEFWRFAQAYSTIPAFKDKWGATEEESWQLFVKQMKGRREKHELLEVDHPRFIKDRVANMKPEEFGFDNWDNFKGL